MLNDNAKLWVAALRSGKYKQTIGYLRNDDGYCCLGVACEVAIENGVKIDHKQVDGQRAHFYDDSAAVMPAKVQAWVNTVTAAGAYTYEKKPTSLLHQNDYGNLDFNQIADLIESEPEGLFIKA